VRAEPLLSQHRQKPWVSMAKIFEVKDSISHADGELSDPVNLVLSRSTGLKREKPNIQANWMAFFGGKGTKEKVRNDLEGQGFLVVEM
jgi:hypothetical protein